MSDTLAILLAMTAAYLVGSIDFAVVVGRMNGVDIRQVGSGNPGASNVLRTIGRLPAAMVMVGDALKGVIGAAMGMIASGAADPLVHWAFLCGLLAVVGHCYPVFHRFRGGKGVATGLGVLLFTVPIVALVALALWGLLAWITKTASIASLVVMVVAAVLAAVSGVEGLALAWLAVMVVFIIWRHRANIARVMAGEEQKVSR